MKLILLILLACACAPALADGDANPCNVPVPPGVPNYYTDLMDNAHKYQCAPTWTGTSVRANGAGVAAWWYCPTGKPGRYAANVAAATHEWIGSHASTLTADIAAALASSDPLANINAVMAKNNDRKMSDPTLTPVWCPYHQEIADGTPGGWYHPEDRPGSWITSGRVSYRTEGGALSGFNGLINTGLACDCASPIRVGASTYCTFAGAAKPSIVAQCKPAP